MYPETLHLRRLGNREFQIDSNRPHTCIVGFYACVARLAALEKPRDAEKGRGPNGRNAVQELQWIIGSLRSGSCFAWHTGATCWKSKSLNRVSFVVSSNFNYTHAIMVITIQDILLSIGLLLPRWTLSDCYHLPPLVTSLFCPHTPGSHTCPKTTVEKPPSFYQMALFMLRPIQ